MKGDRLLGADKPRKPRALTSVLISLLVAVAVAAPMAFEVARGEPQVDQTTSTTIEVDITAPEQTPPSVLGTTEERDPDNPGG